MGVLRGAFEGFGCPKRHPDALLAKTMDQGLSQDLETGQAQNICGSPQLPELEFLKISAVGLAIMRWN